MRELFRHKCNPLNDKLNITVGDAPGDGGANHVYKISGPDNDYATIVFQNGPIAENGINGLTQEVLLAIVIDRLECFQDGPFACEENGQALDHLHDALEWLHIRTRARMMRGVEGTSKQ